MRTLEVDLLPKYLNEQSRDWSELAITRNISEPLYFETANRGIASNIISKHERLDHLNWLLKIEGHSWSNGDIITSDQVIQQIVRSRKAGGITLLPTLFIESLRLYGRGQIHIKTRVPTAHLNRILASPGLSPRHTNPQITSGAYSPEYSKNNSIFLRARNQAEDLNLVEAKHNGRCSFDQGLVDIAGPMSTEPNEWPLVSKQPTSVLQKLDVAYGLILPDCMPLETRKIVNTYIDRVAICQKSNGLVRPLSAFSAIWKPDKISLPASHAAVPDRFLQNIDNLELSYTAFAGNFEIASAIAHEFLEKFGISVYLRLVDYSTFLFGHTKTKSNEMRLVLSGAMWPHPASLIAPFYFGNERNEDFITTFESSLALDDLYVASERAISAEAILQEYQCSVVVIGQVIGCLRSRAGRYWLPPSGWVNFSESS